MSEHSSYSSCMRVLVGYNSRRALPALPLNYLHMHSCILQIVNINHIYNPIYFTTLYSLDFTVYILGSLCESFVHDCLKAPTASP